MLNCVAAIEQSPLDFDDTRAFHVAVIGAGIAGASSAFHLRNFTVSEFNRPLKITVYESAAEIGGQVKTVSPTGSPRDALEAGASHFYDDDWCLTNASQSTNIEWRAAYPGWGEVWDRIRFSQDRFCYKEAPWQIPPFWDPRPHARKKVLDTVARFLKEVSFEWKHRFEPRKLRYKISALQAKFNLFGQNGTFDGVQSELKTLGLEASINSSAEQFLDDLEVPKSLQTIWLELCIRNLFGIDLKDALGLHVIVSFGSTRSHPIDISIGNNNLARRMIEQSGAELQLDSKVVEVATGIQRRFALTIASDNPVDNQRVEYDAVIFTGDSMTQLRPQSAPRPAHIQTHVTHFSSTYSLSPAAFGLGTSSVPLSILTTKNSSLLDEDVSIVRLKSHTEFYIDGRGCSGDDECDQWLQVHRIDSRNYLPREYLDRMAGGEVPDWVDQRSWNRTLPLFNASDSASSNIELEPNLFNTKGNILDTMEMSCRMGRIVALRLHEQKLLSVLPRQESGDAMMFGTMGRRLLERTGKFVRAGVRYAGQMLL